MTPPPECGEESACGNDQACFEDVCVDDGPLRVSLSWTESTDLDLHVRAPDGTEISYVHPRSDTGELDLDDCAQRRCRRPAGPHVENVVFSEDASVGLYEIWVVNFDGLESTSFELEISGPELLVESGNLPAQPAASSSVFTAIYVR